MVTVEETFGTDAGKVWKALSNNPSIPVDEISKKVNLPPSRVYGALGWLAREGKLVIEGTSVYKYKLR